MIYMDEIDTMCSNAITDINIALKREGVVLSEDELDLLWDKLQNDVEKLAGYPDYRNYN
jgi:hypothetical protein